VVVTHSSGPEEARIDLTTDEQPYAVLHDFDGRYVLVSREAWEPALAARTFFVIDLGCADCGLGEPFTTGSAASADLMSAPRRACDLVAQIAAAVVPATNVPDALASQWSELLSAVGNCDYPALDAVTGQAPVVSHLALEVPGWEGAVRLRPSLLVDTVNALASTPTERDGVWYFPGYMDGRLFSDLAPALQVEAERVLADVWGGPASGFETFGEWFDDAGSGVEYPGVIVEFRPDGTIFVAAPLS
ncbi:MAG: hypothetical protein OEM97_06615, partial [Acidimicrobiia bacterium]|nr:hypothetical protein [Acidimicrobiia bacterium]